MLTTGNAIGKKTGQIFPFISVSLSQEFIDYVKINFDRDCEINNDVITIFPSKTSGRNMEISHTRDEVINDHLFLIKFNDSENNTLQVIPFYHLCSQYFLP